MKRFARRGYFGTTIGVISSVAVMLRTQILDLYRMGSDEVKIEVLDLFPV